MSEFGNDSRISDREIFKLSLKNLKRKPFLIATINYTNSRDFYKLKFIWWNKT